MDEAIIELVEQSPELEERVDRLALVCTAMWGLLRQRVGLTAQDLAELVQELDGRDGALDGRYKLPSVACPSCGRRSNRRHRACRYCESPLPARAPDRE